jgi:DNA-binding NarL/FixJ family response regulator
MGWSIRPAEDLMVQKTLVAAGAVVIRVLIVDDQALVGTALRLLLGANDDIVVEDVASGAEEGVRKARLHKPDIVLLDVATPGHSGLDAVREIKEAAPKAEILVLSMQDDQSIVREAFASGVSGYLLKEAIDTELVTAIREVAAGRRYLHPPLGARLAQAEHRAAARAALDPLSDREREVARLLALGHTNQEIAKMLYISVRTAETHRAHIMQKLKLSTRSALVRYALQQGLLADAATA